ncbi:MAG: ribonuclease E/G, partial [Sinobacterium sp.]|nr:ribonuclease E/G [Sinobacterium sp.]
MTDEILVNATPMETRVAMVSNGLLQEVIIERSENRGLVGNIYRGKVVRVLPGMQAAFVEIGLEKAAFIHAADIDRSEGETREIRQLIKEGDDLCVQITKDPISSKGAKITASLSISSRYLVYMTDIKQTGISQRIDDEVERERLKGIVTSVKEENCSELSGGFIVRTAAEQTSENDIRKDMALLQKLWHSLEKNTEKSPALIHEDLPLSLCVLRDHLRDDVEKIRVDSRETIQKMEKFCKKFMPESLPLLEWYPGGRPIFELHHVEQEIKHALSRRVG